MSESHAHDSAAPHADNGHSHAPARTHFEVRILRQNAPGEQSYWERHKVAHEPDMNVISVLQRIAAQATTIDGIAVAPVAWDCNCLEEVCGACTMVVNGHVRQACSALVDRLLEDNAEEIELRPMQKFPVVRDLVVDRGRLFRALEKLHCWIPVDGYYDLGSGPPASPAQQQERYPLSECMSCGCCLDACPQYTKIELERREGETDEQFHARREAAYDRNFVGAHAISQVMLMNLHPTGTMQAGERIDALTAEGGIQVCGNAQNCVQVCPKHIPLTRSIGRAGRAATKRMFQRFFDR
ncbi:MAG TPA: succinate dehydrogenase iron-sulfur subunit [Pirellulales bacterium]|jgi:succinate dehydrogenase / fumarate reductase iron-sulfur subunit|nr:succinate dehydrogenase iron-sulfur subunit [Pirellulales bacterium]